MLFFLACISTKKPSVSANTQIPKEESAEEPQEDAPAAQSDSVAGAAETIETPPALKEVVISIPLPQEGRRPWPKQAWSYAKAYSYNFVPFGPGQNAYLYREGKWNEKIEKSIDINKEQADYALSLVHHTAGSIESSGCVFPRHGIVYFNQADEPVASINYCFSCEGVLVWPPYFDSPKEEADKYALSVSRDGDDSEPQPLVVEIYEQLRPSWENLFLEVLAFSNPSFE